VEVLKMRLKFKVEHGVCDTACRATALRERALMKALLQGPRI
jgi:hypothetical protein